MTLLGCQAHAADNSKDANFGIILLASDVV